MGVELHGEVTEGDDATSLRSLSHTSTRRMLRSRISAAASFAVQCCSIITTSRVMIEPIVVVPGSARSATARTTMSRSVSMPASVAPSVTTTSPMSDSFITRAASSNGVSAER